ncbi:hypothetical protein [Nocardia altamirensis]|uniref:hypothetical protein n=1 Tax=Nocardia altamirensis TaxID=472158 RepID=UPI001435640C|nr:hypothetical protein [Nocardia altamirensis]
MAWVQLWVVLTRLWAAWRLLLAWGLTRVVWKWSRVVWVRLWVARGLLLAWGLPHAVWIRSRARGLPQVVRR